MAFAKQNVRRLSGKEGWAPESNFALFALTIAVGLLLHLTSTTDWFRSPAHLAVTLSALATIVRPNGRWPIVLLSISEVATWAVEMPRAFNHTTLFALVLVAVPVVVLTNRGKQGASLEDGLFPYVRVAVYALFGFAVLHKLNHDFLGADWSCAVEHAETFLARMPLLPGAELDSLRGFLAPATLLAEASIPVLLLFTRTRAIGIAVALAFHAAMGLNGHWAFSAPALALYVPFLPADAWQSSRRLIAGTPVWRWLTIGTIGSVTLIPIIGAFASSVANRLGLATYVLGLVPLSVVVWWASARKREPLVGTLRPWQWAMVGVIVVIGFSPYLGLGTRGNFAMYSNLQTEDGNWNHLFLPRSMQVFDLQDRAATLDEVAYAALEDHLDAPDDKTTRTEPVGSPGIIRIELRRAVAEYCESGATLPADVTVEGSTEHYDDLCTDAYWGTPPPPLAVWALRFRQVETPAVCRQ